MSVAIENQLHKTVAKWYFSSSETSKNFNDIRAKTIDYFNKHGYNGNQKSKK
jgi:hypothetical protein